MLPNSLNQKKLIFDQNYTMNSEPAFQAGDSFNLDLSRFIEDIENQMNRVLPGSENESLRKPLLELIIEITEKMKTSFRSPFEVHRHPFMSDEDTVISPTKCRMDHFSKSTTKLSAEFLNFAEFIRQLQQEYDPKHLIDPSYPQINPIAQSAKKLPHGVRQDSRNRNKEGITPFSDTSSTQQQQKSSLDQVSLGSKNSPQLGDSGKNRPQIEREITPSNSDPSIMNSSLKSFFVYREEDGFCSCKEYSIKDIRFPEWKQESKNEKNMLHIKKAKTLKELQENLSGLLQSLIEQLTANIREVERLNQMNPFEESEKPEEESLLILTAGKSMIRTSLEAQFPANEQNPQTGANPFDSNKEDEPVLKFYSDFEVTEATENKSESTNQELFELKAQILVLKKQIDIINREHEKEKERIIEQCEMEIEAESKELHNFLEHKKELIIRTQKETLENYRDFYKSRLSSIYGILVLEFKQRLQQISRRCAQLEFKVERLERSPQDRTNKPEIGPITSEVIYHMPLLQKPTLT